ncbi:MAG TPA: tripartite tricarboxylate transporter substrate binding protein [Pseudolabrys sp.]|jgi:tripartite-type tricarboxylate transporter receptor subunit TctC|nr:tripartite tricarboxylate transporter substrate binding protein [Pseudolabrys sp.]
MRSLARAAFAAAVLVLAPLPAQAKWPEKPIKIVLPFGAGGVADVTARVLADRLDKLFGGHGVVIENMPGPGGINAARTVVNAPPDGYTMGLVTNGTAISVAAFKHLPFDPVKQFAMVSELGEFNLLFAVDANSKYKTLADFVKDAKANPGKLNIGTIAVGGTQNLGGELFKSLADVNVQIVPYKNSGDVVVAVLRNDVQMLIDFPPAINGQVKAGKLRVLASSGAKREAEMPNVPTVQEAGIKGYEVSSWNGVFAPKGTPQDVIEAMNKAMRQVLAAPDVKAQFARVGVEPRASSPQELMDRLKADIVKWNAVIDKAGIPRK